MFYYILLLSQDSQNVVRSKQTKKFLIAKVCQNGCLLHNTLYGYILSLDNFYSTKTACGYNLNNGCKELWEGQKTQ